MKLAVVGSREIKDQKLIFDKLNLIHKQYGVEKIISGGAKGVDSIAVAWAKENKIEWEEKIPDWNTPTPGVKMKKNKFGKMYNPIAGHLRNTKIIDDSTHVLAFWDGKSTGTNDSIEKAKKQNKLLEIVYVNNKQT